MIPRSPAAATIVKKFISRDRVVAILGEIASSRSLEAAPICQNAKIPMISPGSTAPEVTARGDYIFRVCFIDSFQGTVMAKFATQRGWKKVAILSSSSSAYSVGLAKYFKETHLAGGGTLAFAQVDGDASAALVLTGLANLTGGTLASSPAAGQPGAWLMELTDSAGTTVAAGRGFPAGASFADALWGVGSRAAVQSRDLGVSNALLGLAEGGNFGAIGTAIGQHTRLAITVSDTQAAADTLLGGAVVAQSLIDSSWS